MQYMIELRYQKDQREDALKFFWDHGATHYDAHVTIKEGWVATEDLVAYALIEAESNDAVTTACAPLKDFGEVSYRRVTSFDEM